MFRRSKEIKEQWWSRFLDNSSLLREYLWKYRRWVGIGLVSLLIIDIADIFPPILMKWVVDVVLEHRPQYQLLEAALIYFGICVLQGICRYIWRMYLIRSSIHSGRDLRSRFARHLFGLSMSILEKKRLGDLMSHATSDVEAVRTAIGSGLLVFADALFYLLTIPVAMYFLSPQLTLLACLPLPLIPLYILRNERKIRERFEKVQDCFARMSSLSQEGLQGIRVIKAFAKEDVQLERLNTLSGEYQKLSLELSRVQVCTGPAMDFMTSLGMVLLLFVGGKWVIHDPHGAITLGTFVAFQRYIQKLVWPMAALGMAINYYQRSIISSNRIKQILNQRTDVPDLVSPEEFHRKLVLQGGSLSMKGHIEFQDLSFTYPGGLGPVLKGLNLTIGKGERVAIMGRIGAGKSTLLSLLPRLYPVKSGMLKIDGEDINLWPLDLLRQNLGYVSQEVFLFSETVMENIALGLHDWKNASYSVQLVDEASQVARVRDEVSRLEMGFQTRLGERGINLSGGQKQRITLARAIAKQPSILILDDALSSVDVHTEEKILQSLKDRPNRNTELIAAHRTTTVKDADRIIVLEKGEILQMGTHTELLRERSGLYYKMFEQQQLQEHLEEELERYENELQ